MQYINQTVISTIVIGLFVCSISCQIIIGVFLQKGIQNTDHVTGTDQGMLKLCKQKFIQSYKANGGVANISIFVDKFINKLRIFHMSIVSFRHLSGQIMLVGVFVAGLGVCKGLLEGTMIVRLLPYYMICFFGLYVYFCVSSMVDERGRRYMLRVNLIDYLENHVALRLENGYVENAQLLEQEQQEVRKEKRHKDQRKKELVENLMNQNKKHVKNEDIQEAQEGKDDGEKRHFTKEDAEELEALLKAFMV